MSVVLPCLNEAGSVALVVRQALDALAASEISGEVVVADNGSSDGSADLARAAGARVVDVPVRGYGAALSAGFEAAKGEICVMGDADATYPFELLEILVEPIAKGEADMAIGSRLAGATGKTMPFLHRFVGTPLITWLVRRAGGPIGVADSQSGFRAFRRDRLLGLRLQSTGMEYASEMLVLAGRAGWRVQEVDAGYRERIGNSKLETFPDGMRHQMTILLLAPDLAAIIPGTLAVIAGVLAILWALIDPAIRDPGSAGWWASFVAPAMLVLGSQAIMVGLLLADRSPLARRPRGPSSDLLPVRYLLGGVWAVSAGLILIAALAIVRVLGFQAPFRGPQIEMIALVLVLVGGSAVGISLITRVLDEGMRRYPRSPDLQSQDRLRQGEEAGDGGAPAIAGEAERSRW
ncbi:MAG: glycosyltransferase family 2 protein [Acidimicrobiia bacterium]